MSQYAWMCIYKQDSEYALGPKAKVLNMGKLWICQGFQYASVTQHSEYARIGRVLNMSYVLNMLSF